MIMKSRSHLSRIVAVILLSFLQLAGASPQQQETPAAPPPEVPILGSQLLKITSSIVGREYHLYVNLPRGYQDTSKTFPVIYLTDGQWDFPLAVALFGEQYYDGFVPAAIIVGITWGGTDPNYDSLRAIDLTPTGIQQVPHSGNAPKFLAFIKEELIPFIESKYRAAKNDRTLMGSSLGGLFTLYALFHEAGVFNRYILTSPALGWDNGVIYTFEKTYAEKNRRLPARLFMAMGGLEAAVGGGEFQKFIGQLRSRKYEGLDLETRVLENTGHSGSKAEGYGRGLQAVFARPSLRLSADLLAQYVGRYQVAPGFAVEIVREGDGLVLVAPGNARLPLRAESEENFYCNGMYLLLRFKRNEQGKVAGFDIEQYAGQGFATRID
jgi:predicted alpha/beta superfamily hydrolase